MFQGDRDESNKVDESTAETDAEDLYEVGINCNITIMFEFHFVSLNTSLPYKWLFFFSNSRVYF